VNKIALGTDHAGFQLKEKIKAYLSAERYSEETALEIVDTWLKAKFQGGRHQRRLEKIERDATWKSPDH